MSQDILAKLRELEAHPDTFLKKNSSHSATLVPTETLAAAACAIELLRKALSEARRLNNLTVRAANEISVWHREADRLLADSPAIDDPSERYDAPSRVAHRAFVDRLFQKR